MKRLLTLARSNPNSRLWYKRERKALQKFCKAKGWDFKTFCDVLAITSPRVQLKRNFKFACQYMAGESFYCSPMSQIVRSLEIYEQTGKVSGPKVSRFALALQGRQDVVVLDIWMSRLLGVDYEKMYSPKIYAKLEKKIAKLAEVLGWYPAEVQAALWGNYLASLNRRIYTYSNLIRPSS